MSKKLFKNQFITNIPPQRQASNTQQLAKYVDAEVRRLRRQDALARHVQAVNESDEPIPAPIPILTTPAAEGSITLNDVDKTINAAYGTSLRSIVGTKPPRRSPGERIARRLGDVDDEPPEPPRILTVPVGPSLNGGK